jgi:dTDP-4-dehydrorhamnose 3,5-epimerase
MKSRELKLPGLRLITPDVFGDARGFVLESYSEPRYLAAGVECRFVQDTHSRSLNGTLRGLHYQSTPGQAKLLRVGTGRIFDVAVDIRPDSPTFGQWEGVTLDAETHEQLFLPVGFAHGFCVLSETADVLYKVSTVYDPKTECTLRWDDPEIGVTWPLESPLLSARDRAGESFAEFKKRMRR